jgi:2-phospho-L-lactate guanylyltransferase
MTAGWTAIVPVKPPSLAKSRLDVDPLLREKFARAFALDVLDAVSQSPSIDRVIVVTADVSIAGRARSRGMVTVADRPMLAAEGLDRAVRAGRDWAVRHWATSPVAVVPADLPALTPDVLATSLDRLAEVERGFVPDAAGTGTTVSTALDPAALRPLFGPGSAIRHAQDGVIRLIDVDPRIRRDVDTVADLAAARLLGVGAWTSEVFQLEHERMRHAHPRRTSSPAGIR